jgi:hypothetical protein
MTWVDYKKTDTLRYKSFNDTLSHIVINNHKSERYSFNKNLDCVCGASAGFVSDINKNGYNIIGSCYYSDDLIDVSYRFQTSEIEDLFEFRYDLSNNQLLDDLTIINYELNGVVLSNVGMLENTNNIIISKVYFTSEKGLIAFVDNNNTEWKLIE